MTIRDFGDTAYFSEELGLTSVKQCTEGAIRFKRAKDTDDDLGSYLFSVAVYSEAEGKFEDTGSTYALPSDSFENAVDEHLALGPLAVEAAYYSEERGLTASKQHSEGAIRLSLLDGVIDGTHYFDVAVYTGGAFNPTDDRIAVSSKAFEDALEEYLALGPSQSTCAGLR
jgi:hypothetical protein